MMKLIYTYIFFLNIVFLSTGNLQGQDMGKVASQIYTPKEHKGRISSWTVTHDEYGFTYLANERAVFYFDGERWEVILHQFVRSMHYDKEKKRLYYGGIGRFGYVEIQANGTRKVVELTNNIEKKEYRSIADVFSVQQNAKGEVFFQTNYVTFLYSPSQNKIIAYYPTQNAYHRAIVVDDELYVRQEGIGITVLKNGKWQTIPNTEPFKDGIMGAAFPWGNNQILFGNRVSGLYLYDKTKNTTIPYDTPLSRHLQQFGIYGAYRLANRNIAWISSIHGITISDANAQYVIKTYTGENGLVSNSVLSVSEDKQGGLWAVGFEGISRINLNTPYEIIENGLKGDIQNFFKRKDGFYTTNNIGAFRYNPSQKAFELIQGMNTQMWSNCDWRLNGKEKWLMASTTGIFEVSGSTSKLLSPLRSLAIRQHPLDSTILVVFTHSAGIYFFKYDGQNPLKEYAHIPQDFAKINPYIIIMDKRGYFVSASFEDGRSNAFRRFFFDIKQKKITNAEVLFTLSSQKGEEANISEQSYYTDGQGNTYFVYTQKQVLKTLCYNEDTGKIQVSNFFHDFIPQEYNLNEYEPISSILSSENRNTFVLRLRKREPQDTIQNHHERFLGNGNQKTVLLALQKQRDGKYKHQVLDDSYVEEPDYQPILIENDGTLWLGTYRKMYKVNINICHKKKVKFSTFIRQVVIQKDSILYGGIYAEGVKIPVPYLPYKNHSISVEFAAPIYDGQDHVEYSYFLEGENSEDTFEHWSEWKKEPKALITNLREGKYTFRVKSRNAQGIEGDEASISFVIQTPWFRTPYAYIGGAILLLGSFFGYSRWSSKRLRMQNERLERLIEKRTIEIKQKNIDLEIKSEEIKAQSEELRVINENIMAKNVEIEQQKEELETQKDLLHERNEELVTQKELIENSLNNIKLLSQMGQDITASLSLEKIMSVVHENINKLMNAPIFGVGIYNADEEALDFVSTYENGKVIPPYKALMKEEHKLSVRCFAQQEEILINDFHTEYTKYTSNPHFFSEEVPQSLVYVPLTSCGNKIGVLTIQCFCVGAYDSYKLGLLRNLAIYITIAIENARSYWQIEKNKEVIEKRNHDITSSINYAKQIQTAMLPTRESITAALPDSFILFKPRDIVSGDFYWFAEVENKIVLAVADCTGHGVPGAFMSMIGNDLLNEIVNLRKILSPDEVLNALTIGIRNALRQQATMNRDGMDIALCVIDKEQRKIEFAGAKNPLIHIRNGEFTKIAADKMPIGGAYCEFENISFHKHTIFYQQEDSFYIFSDGYQDQFGGKEGKKFMSKNFHKLLAEISVFEPEKQRQILEETIETWKGKENQIDDILVVGFRL